MKYQQPTERKYEDSLTARVLYNAMGSLLQSYAENVATAGKKDEKQRLFAKYGNGNLFGKEWEVDEVRSELEEFVQSYFFDGIETKLPGFKERFETTTKNPMTVLKDYLSQLDQSYVSSPEGQEQLKSLRGLLNHRYSIFKKQLEGLKSLENVDETVLENAKDAFAALFLPYSLIGNRFKFLEN